ncbi:regulatory protein RecX [Alkalimarinus sediminis]|uniref:Regulatory protein RecX n=1 Tax=Alkalimarinus sediminis TaxID=1632866 RepID=A0A9E8HPF6_9ALTE|nr:regulatory protein RecX [Alkalimarinus sediminis]UZW76696.1 recombination regulator RecX [Alkalimarinus sediminis]
MNSSESGQERQEAPENEVLTDIRGRIIRALARREHSRYELKVKMTLKSFDSGLIDRVLDQLEFESLVSDERFAEAYCYHRKARGFGPVKIATELRERQVDNSLVDRYVDPTMADWFESASYQREKKFGASKIKDFADKAKQMRFLYQKGFTQDQISSAIGEVS